MLKVLAAATAVLFVSAPALAQTASAPSITVVNYLAPNLFGSPSYSTWEANAVNALKGGVAGTAGTPNTPGFAFQQSNITRADMLVTGFASWKGDTNPAATFGPAYANELGTRAAFGVIINGNGTMFSVSQLTHSSVSNDAANAFGYGPFDGYIYGTGNPFGENLVGVQVGTDGKLFTSDDIYVTSGAATQLVDGLIGVADANGLDPCDGTSFACDTDASRKAAIASALNSIDLGGGAREPWPTSYTGTFSLLSAGAPLATGSGSFTIAAPVPEPATWGMLLLGFAGIGATMRRRSAVRGTRIRFV